MKKNIVLICLLSGICGGLVAFIGMSVQNINDETKVNPATTQLSYTPIQNVAYSSNNHLTTYDFCPAAETCMPAVVHIKTSYNQPSYSLYDFIFGTQSATQVSSSGSGVIISSDGYIVTNHHVIANAEIIEVVLNNKKSYTGKVVGKDAITDLALLKIDADDLPFISYGNSDNVKIGEWVLAIGNPFNLTSTVTAGIVSAKARNIDANSGSQVFESYIQTDAAVNPGSSGGALVNTKGELIGINSAIASQTGSYVGYSFAIPVNMVRKVVADLVEFGIVQRPYIGIEMIDLNTQIANKLNVDDVEGVYVANVFKGSAAENAGIVAGNVILAINDIKVNSATELLEHVSIFRPGTKISMEIKDGKKTKTVNLVLQNKYGNTELVTTYNSDVLGARFEPLNENTKRRLGIRNGLQIVELSAGSLASSGIKNSFIIVRANKVNINSLSDLERVINSSEGTIFVEGIYPNGATAYYAFKVN